MMEPSERHQFAQDHCRRLADQLVNSYQRFLAQEGIQVPDYLRVLDIPV